MQLILASTSPRRQELLRLLDLEFSVLPPAVIDEERFLNTHPGPLRQRLSALALTKGGKLAAAHPRAVVLSADTVVYSYRRCLGKPRDLNDARRMLWHLSGHMHRVYTAVAVQRAATWLTRSARASFSGMELTRVWFNELSPAQIESYVVREQPLDKAGAYAIQDGGALLVRRIEGEYSNVVGLPLALTAQLLRQAGLPLA